MYNNVQEILGRKWGGLVHLRVVVLEVLGKIDVGPSSAKYLPGKLAIHIRSPSYISLRERSKEKMWNYYSWTVSLSISLSLPLINIEYI